MKFKLSKKYKQYLPSKHFVRVVGSGAAFALVLFLIFGVGNGKENFSKSKTKNINKVSSVSDLLQIDTDGDGVMDWEESLWGTNKSNPSTYNDTPDAVYIKQQKEALNIEDNADTKGLNETEEFAREFFASYTALQTYGTDSTNISNFSRSIGERIGDPNLEDVYSANDIKPAGSGKTDINNYYNSVQSLFDKYRNSGMGNEVNIVNAEIVAQSSGGSTDYSQLNSISKSYKNFAAELIKIPVPNTYSTYHLGMANAAYNTGVSISSLVKVSDDPLVGLAGLAQYQKYSDDLALTTANLEEKLILALE